MKNIFLAAAALLSSSVCLPVAAQTAETRLFCLSLRFDQARNGGPNAIYNMDLTGIFEGINGELYPVFSADTTHYSYLVMTDTLFDEQSEGTMNLNVPGTDTNNDGFQDIFDSSLNFNGTSTGTYSIPGFSSGAVTATWSRGANSTQGTCRLVFAGLGSFTHNFHILEYRGTLSYTPGTNIVQTALDLTLVGDPALKLQGSLALDKSDLNPYDELDFGAGVLTNTVANPNVLYPYVDDFLSRDETWPTNYFSFLEFDDWLITTTEPDYFLWVLSIDDLNDADNDGIPDLSDDPAPVTTIPPVVSLKRAGNTVVLRVSGPLGRVAQIQQKSSLELTNWPTVLSVTLTNDPQSITLPINPATNAFIRVRIP